MDNATILPLQDEAKSSQGLDEDKNNNNKCDDDKREEMKTPLKNENDVCTVTKNVVAEGRHGKGKQQQCTTRLNL